MHLVVQLDVGGSNSLTCCWDLYPVTAIIAEQLNGAQVLTESNQLGHVDIDGLNEVLDS